MLLKRILLTSFLSCSLFAHDTPCMPDFGATLAKAPLAKNAKHRMEKKCRRGPRGHRGHRGHRGKHGRPGATGATGAPGPAGGVFTAANLWATDTTEVDLVADTPQTLSYSTISIDQSIVPIGTTQFQVTNSGYYQINFFLGNFEAANSAVLVSLYINGTLYNNNTFGTNTIGNDSFLSGIFLVQLNAGDSISLVATSIGSSVTIGPTTGQWNRYIGIIKTG